MSLELFKVGENGQMEIDFNSLEALTNEELVRCVKSAIDAHKNSSKGMIAIRYEKVDLGIELSTKFRVYVMVEYACYVFLGRQFKNEEIEIIANFMPFDSIRNFIEMEGQRHEIN